LTRELNEVTDELNFIKGRLDSCGLRGGGK